MTVWDSADQNLENADQLWPGADHADQNLQSADHADQNLQSADQLWPGAMLYKV